MATESLIVELDARTGKLDSKLNKTEDNLDRLDGSVRKTDKGMASFSKGLTVVTAAAAAAAAAASALVVSTVQYAKELSIAAQRAGESVERIQALAFAADTVGISMEKLGDISKDTQEKIGEFLATGGGGFKDFVDVLGLTNIEARKVAEEFESLSGPQVLQEMVKRLEAAGVSGQRLSFALEGMASDATDLIPLFTDNGKELDRLTGSFEDLDSALSQADVEKIKLVGERFKELNTVFSNESKQLVADYSEELIKAFALISSLAEGIADFGRVVTSGIAIPYEVASAAINDFVIGTDTLSDVLKTNENEAKTLIDDLFNTEGLTDKVLDFTDEVKTNINEILGVELFETGRESGSSLMDGIAEGIAGNKKPLEITIRGGKELSDWEKLNSKERLAIQQKYIKAASILSTAYFEDNKALNAGLIVADTAAGVMMAFRSASNPYEAYANAAIIAATGLAQLSNLNSASKGGGNISSGGSSGATTSAPTSQPDFVPETDTLEFTDSTSGGSQTQTIRFASDTGDALVDAIAEALNKGRTDGRF